MANASMAGPLQDAATAHGRRLLAHAAAEEKPAGPAVALAQVAAVRDRNGWRINRLRVPLPGGDLAAGREPPP